LTEIKVPSLRHQRMLGRPARWTPSNADGQYTGLAILEDAMIRYLLSTLLLIAACLSEPALSQINPFRGNRGTPLNADDMAALRDATNRLLDRPQLVATQGAGLSCGALSEHRPWTTR
jgi:hypothetical protein